MEVIDYNRRVNVYFNLHKRLFSVTQGGIVQMHSDSLMILDARFLVGKAGQAKVRATGRKNVHAKVSGYVADFDLYKLSKMVIKDHEWRKAYYNPYDTDTFVDYADRIPLYNADAVILTMANAIGVPSIMYANEDK